MQVVGEVVVDSEVADLGREGALLFFGGRLGKGLLWC